MGIKVFVVLFVIFTFYSGNVMGSHCTLPWLMEINPLLSKVESIYIESCPSPNMDRSKEYCCYNRKGNPECCNLQQFIIFEFVILIPVLIILLIFSSIICGIYCKCCPFYKDKKCDTSSNSQLIIQYPTNSLHSTIVLSKFIT